MWFLTVHATPVISPLLFFPLHTPTMHPVPLILSIPCRHCRTSEVLYTGCVEGTRVLRDYRNTQCFLALGKCAREMLVRIFSFLSVATTRIFPAANFSHSDPSTLNISKAVPMPTKNITRSTFLVQSGSGL